jgi:hypothetical protein
LFDFFSHFSSFSSGWTALPPILLAPPLLLRVPFCFFPIQPHSSSHQGISKGQTREDLCLRLKLCGSSEFLWVPPPFPLLVGSSSPRASQDLISEDEESFVETNTSFSSVKEFALSPPISRRSSSVGLDLETTSHTPTANMTLLQEAVSSLSLADKCALSLSLGNSRMQSPNDFEVS